MIKTLLIFIGISTILMSDFSKNNNVIVDNKTNLSWEDVDNPKLNWQDALNHCNTLILEGYDDWRLPNRNELLSIVDYNYYIPAINPIFSHTSSRPYWTSTTRTDEDISFHAWIIDFINGSSEYINKATEYNVRCVRDL